MMFDENERPFRPAAYFANAGVNCRLVELESGCCFFTQGEQADSVFCLLRGRAKLAFVSKKGKQATITFLSPGDFFGEEAIGNVPRMRLTAAIAVNTCTALKVTKEDMISALHHERGLVDSFLSCLLARSIRIHGDLVDQILSTSEQRLARVLLLMAESREPDEVRAFIPPITQETLAEMIGTTRSRVSFFMNRFRNRGLIDYKGRIQVHMPRLKAILVE